MVRYKSPYFPHVFGGDYCAAGYYSYIWAAVLDVDAFEAFRENGLFDRKTARAFREHILARGGAEPKIEALLRRRDLLEKETDRK